MNQNVPDIIFPLCGFIMITRFNGKECDRHLIVWLSFIIEGKGLKRGRKALTPQLIFA